MESPASSMTLKLLSQSPLLSTPIDSNLGDFSAIDCKEKGSIVASDGVSPEIDIHSALENSDEVSGDARTGNAQNKSIVIPATQTLLCESAFDPEWPQDASSNLGSGRTWHRKQAFEAATHRSGPRWEGDHRLISSGGHGAEEVELRSDAETHTTCLMQPNSLSLLWCSKLNGNFWVCKTR